MKMLSSSARQNKKIKERWETEGERNQGGSPDGRPTAVLNSSLEEGIHSDWRAFLRETLCHGVLIGSLIGSLYTGQGQGQQVIDR